MPVANGVDGDDRFLKEDLELGVGIIDVCTVDGLNQCLCCVGALQAAGIR